MRQEPYTLEEVSRSVEESRERLFAPYASNRPPTWNACPRTKDLVVYGNWLDEELRRLGIDDLGRRTQTGQYNRASRSEEDLLALVVRILNDTLVDKVDRDRIPHRRWG